MSTDLLEKPAIAPSRPTANEMANLRRDAKRKTFRRIKVGALVAALALLTITGTSSLGGKTKTTFNSISNTLPGGPDPAAYSPATPVQEEPVTPTPSTQLTTQLIVYTASLTMESNDIDQTVAQIQQDLAAANGYVFADNRTPLQASLTLKSPPAQFKKLLRSISKRAHVIDQEMQAQDVTAEGADLDARLTASTTSRDRVRVLLSEAKNIQDVITLETELKQRETEVDQIAGQKRVLQSQVSMATLTVEVVKTTKVVSTVSNVERHSDPSPARAFKGGWRILQWTARWSAVAVAASLPFVPVVAVPYGVVRLVRRRKRRTN